MDPQLNARPNPRVSPRPGIRLAAEVRHQTVLIARDPGPLIGYVLMGLLLITVTRPLYAAVAPRNADKAVSGIDQAAAGMAVMFSLFALKVGAAHLLNERTWHTWDRLLASPARFGEILLGKAAPIFLAVAVQQALLFGFAAAAFGLHPRAGWWALACCALGWSACVLLLGFGASTLARSPAQLSAAGDVFALLTTVLGGALVPVALLPGWLRAIAPASPGYWALGAYRDALAGTPGQLARPLLMLGVFALAGAGGAALIGAWQRRPAVPVLRRRTAAGQILRGPYPLPALLPGAAGPVPESAASPVDNDSVNALAAGRPEAKGARMFREQGPGYRRRSRRAGAWRIWLAVIAGSGAAVLAVHYATAPSTVDAASAANVAKAGDTARNGYHGYGRGGYTMMPHGSEAAEAAEATTENWSGYAATGSAGTFTSVTSSWEQPAVTCDDGDTFSSFWVGLDGVNTQDLEQTGTEADCSGGTAEYSGWFEFFPAAPVFYDNPVEPGDDMTASVTTDSGGSFTLTLSDTTAGWTRTTDQTVQGAGLSSAEVIAEAPSSQSVLPLADFAAVNFTGADVNGQAIGDDSPTALTMVSSGGTTEATPSALSGGDSFTVTWDSDGTAAGPAGPGNGGGNGGGTGTGTPGTGRHHHHRDQN